VTASLSGNTSQAPPREGGDFQTETLLVPCIVCTIGAAALYSLTQCLRLKLFTLLANDAAMTRRSHEIFDSKGAPSRVRPARG
jgi:hypothetical protein